MIVCFAHSIHTIQSINQFKPSSVLRHIHGSGIRTASLLRMGVEKTIGSVFENTGSLYPRGGQEQAQKRSHARLPSLVYSGKGKSNVEFLNFPRSLFVFDG